MGIFKQDTVASVLGIDKTIAKLKAVAVAHENKAIAKRARASELNDWAQAALVEAKSADAEVRLANAAISGIEDVLFNCGLSDE